MPVSKSGRKMRTKPILLWPKPRSDIEVHLDRGAENFSVVDTNCAYELHKLYNIKRTTPVFDPFPYSGTHYRDFRDHFNATDHALHIAGVEACRNVLRAMDDPILARSSVEELLAATTAGSRPTFHAPMKITVDWSCLNWTNIVLSAVLVFVASLMGNALFVNNSLIAAIVAAFAFAAFYVCVRINVLEGWRRIGDVEG
jgi:hypothetical protein